MKTVAIIQARLGSSRFTRKVLAPLWGRTVIEHVVSRARRIHGVDQVVVACPPADLAALTAHLVDEDVRFATVVGILESDVLGRYASAAAAWDADCIVRLTADCPAFRVDLAGWVLEQATEGGYDLVSCASGRTAWPDGWDVEVFTRACLSVANRLASDPTDREHVTPWMYRHARHYLYEPIPGSVPDSKLSIDTPEDLTRLEAIGEPS